MKCFKIYFFAFLFIMFGILACKPTGSIELVVQSDHQWTGIALSSKNRMFVNFPKWSDTVPVHLAEIINGQIIPYPNLEWNDSKMGQNKFKALQSVFIDRLDRLWVLETANPQFKGVDSVGPILYQFDLETNQMVEAYTFNAGVYLPKSYFNDVRVDEKNQKAYITDSSEGAIIVLDLVTRQARRLLDKHPAVMAEIKQLVCDDFVWEGSVNSDGLDLNADRSYLYFAALSGHTLYRVSTKNLTDSTLTVVQLSPLVERVTSIPATDGILFDPKGNIWFGGLENEGVNKLDRNGKWMSFGLGQIKWADSFAIGSDGYLYFACSQIHLPQDKREKYAVMRIQL